MKKQMCVLLAVVLAAMSLGAMSLGAMSLGAMSLGAMAEEAVTLPDPEAITGAVEAGAADAAENETVVEAAAEPEEDEGEPFTLWFEEGFSLELPAGWVSYPVSEAEAGTGLRYALGDGTGAHFLYVQAQPAASADMAALARMIEDDAGKQMTGELNFGGRPFVAFIDVDNDLSGCSTVRNGEILSFLFVPRGDANYMMTATSLMETFTEMK